MAGADPVTAKVAPAEKEETPRSRGLRVWLPKHRRFITWIVVVLLLSLIGTMLGPGWNPQPMDAVIQPETADTQITTAAPTAQVGTYEVTTKVLTFTLSDGSTNVAKVMRPVGLEGELPGMVFVHGTGTDSIDSFNEEAERIASTGIVTMVPQKRVANYTTTHRDYVALAIDYEDALEKLRQQPGVAHNQVGLYAVSEGCFVAPIIAARNPNVAYVAFVSAPVLPIRQQGGFAADAYLREIGAPIQVINAIPKLLGNDFGEEDFRYIDFDPGPYEAQITAPVMMLYGTGDNSMPIIQGPLIMAEHLREAGNRNLTLRYYRDADHGLRVGPLGERQLVLTAMQDVADWVNGMPYTANSLPQVAGAQPVQQYQAGAVHAVPNFLNGNVILGAMGLAVALALLVLILELVGLIRIRGRALAQYAGSGKALNLSLLWIIATWILYLWYLLVIARIALNYGQDRLVVQGGYLGIQICALLAAWWFVRWIYRWFYGRRRGARSAPEPAATLAADGAPECPARMNAYGHVVSIVALVSQVLFFVTLGYWNAFPAIL